MLFRVRPAPSPIRLGRPLPVPPIPPRRENHGEAVERTATHARTHAYILTHTDIQSLSLSYPLFCSFSHFLFLFASRRFRTSNSYDEDSLRMEDLPFLVLSLEQARLRIHPSLVDCSFIFLLLLQLQGRAARFSYIPPLCLVFSFYVFDRK